MTSMFDDQARHIAYIVAEALARGARTVEPTDEGQDAWAAQLASPSSGGDGGGGFLKSCTPGYYNNEGRSTGGNAFFGAYPRGINAFNQLLDDWRTAGDLDGLELIFDE